MEEMDLDKEEPLPSSLTRREELSPQAQEFSPARVFNEPSSFLPTTPTGVSPVRGAPPTLDPSQVPIGSKPAKKRSLLGHAEPSVFDILNTFQCCWFISMDHLRTTVLLAQKAEDGKIFWVEFTPQFHAHLVKCYVHTFFRFFIIIPRGLSSALICHIRYKRSLLCYEWTLLWYAYDTMAPMVISDLLGIPVLAHNCIVLAQCAPI
jgi:hypothetical protein